MKSALSMNFGAAMALVRILELKRKKLALEQKVQDLKTIDNIANHAKANTRNSGLSSRQLRKARKAERIALKRAVEIGNRMDQS